MVIILLFGFSHMKSSPENWNLDGILYLHQETATSGTWGQSFVPFAGGLREAYWSSITHGNCFALGIFLLWNHFQMIETLSIFAVILESFDALVQL
jgi:hypothetical protein